MIVNQEGETTLSQKLALGGALLLHRAQQARFGGRRAIRVARAELLQVRRIARVGRVIERQREPCAGARPDRLAQPVDRRDEGWLSGARAASHRTVTYPTSASHGPRPNCGWSPTYPRRGNRCTTTKTALASLVSRLAPRRCA